MPELAKLIHGLGFSRDRPMKTNENAPESKLVTESNVATESNIAAGSKLTSELKNASELKLATESKVVSEFDIATESRVANDLNVAAGSKLANEPSAAAESKVASESKLALASKVERDSNLAILSLEVAYNGAPFSGFARQPGQLTVQGSIEEALALIFRHPVETVCAGRTDSGVHAKGQVVSFCVTQEEYEQRNDYKLLRSLNALTHEDISVRSIARRADNFSARFSATMREYRYFICVDKAAPLFMKNFSWHIPKELDIEAMRQAATYLIGEHDFKSFCLAVSAEGKSTMRNVFSITVEPEELWGESLVVITVKGNAFLHSMVRTIVGSLVAVGRGQRKPEWISEVLEARNRSAAGENAPAQGLVFWRVSYEGKRVHDPLLR